jgi:L-threonylcarbamoyladenylate synthase
LKAQILSVGQVDVAAKIVSEGGIVGLPTDTVYGLACDPTNRRSADRLFVVKGRDAKPVPILCSDPEAAQELVSLGDKAAALAARYWPGALTIVAPMREGALRRIAPTIHQDSGWLGVRVPDHRFATSLARRAGGCITGTSANLSGRPSCRSAEEVAGAMGSQLDAIVDGGRLGGLESTVIRVVGETVEVLRRGSIAIEQGSKSQESQQHQ